MQRAERRNITVSSERVSDAFDRAENVSKFIEKCVVYYLDEQEQEYATVDDLEATKEELKYDMQILNKNFLATKEVLEQVAIYMNGGSVE